MVADSLVAYQDLIDPDGAIAHSSVSSLVDGQRPEVDSVYTCWMWSSTAFRL